MKVTRLPRDPGPAGWARLLPNAPPAEPLDRDVTTDWLVIGAGFAGLAATRRLTERAPGDRILLLDACRVGEGPAGRNSGFMIDLPHDLASGDYAGGLARDQAQTADNRMAIAYARSMVEAFGLPDAAMRRTGKLNAAASATGAALSDRYARHLEAMGEPFERRNAAQMRALTGTDYYQSGLYTPGAALIQPALYVRGVAQGLRSNRVSLHEQTPVTALKRDGVGWRANTPQGTVKAGRVILAVNGHLASFGFHTNALMHVFTYASMTRALTQDEVQRLGGAPDWGVLPAHPMGTTVRRVSGQGGERIVIRNRFTFDPTMEVTGARIEAVGRDHDKAFSARFPMLKGVTMEHRWGGRLCLARNDVQVVRELEPGLFAACCQNGLGTVKGTLAGMMAADLATGYGSETLDWLMAAPDPTPLPPMPLTKLGAAARLRWGEWLAGREF
ncbi:NAD(P)/FAD-dependent oxidoreductase [Pseudaestuariivita sp.]|uniref:NAD(P)/FAD-dependent oxidoreductase n=1 Tax=Pseudaestuariivita sp. TaxID=2211669 RepID=UPI004057FB44